jgi:hypothetical protein
VCSGGKWWVIGIGGGRGLEGRVNENRMCAGRARNAAIGGFLSVVLELSRAESRVHSCGQMLLVNTQPKRGHTYARVRVRTHTHTHTHPHTHTHTHTQLHTHTHTHTDTNTHTQTHTHKHTHTHTHTHTRTHTHTHRQNATQPIAARDERWRGAGAPYALLPNACAVPFGTIITALVAHFNPLLSPNSLCVQS